MGKPYAIELQQLADTYAVAMSMDIDRLAVAVAASASHPLLAVGSGGAITVAHFMVALHQRCVQKVSKAVTTLDLIETGPVTKDLAV